MPESLKTACKSFYGYGWQSKLARDMGVSVRTVQRWVAGRPMPQKMVSLATLLLAHQLPAIPPITRHHP